MKINLQRLILFIIIFIFVLMFFGTKSCAAEGWALIKSGEGTPSDDLNIYGWRLDMIPDSAGGGSSGGTTIYEWLYSEKNYKLVVTATRSYTNWKLYSWDSGELNTGDYKTGLQYEDASYLFSKGAFILKLLRNIAAIVSVLTLSIIGVKYMIGSVEQKAEYKQTMIPVVIGCILIGGLSAILTIIQSIF